MQSFMTREENPWRRKGLREWCRVEIRTSDDSTRVVDLIARLMADESYPTRDIYAVGLALTEALANALKHGHREDPNKVVRFRCWGNEEEITASVLDEGTGFDPNAVPNPVLHENLGRPSGRGLVLMRAYTSSLRFNANGNGLTMSWRRAGL
jgi:serine/threonine-protein kinase RsbW